MYPDLPKWPALVVVGEPVTPEQAQEIIIRTDSLYFSSNDRRFEEDLYKTLGVTFKDYSPDWHELDDRRKEYQVLDIDYLQNHRIVSSWIGGPHGWCFWNGRIGTHNYNIGKWPSVEEVEKEWKMIARAFPYLQLQAQLFDGEVGEEQTSPIVTFTIERGKVKVDTQYRHRIDLPTDDFSPLLIFAPGAERGCRIDEFKTALATTAHSLRRGK
jgi:hypothetical protein